MGDMVDHPLDPEHPLGAAEAAEGGGRLGVGPQPVALDPHVLQMIGVVGMQHRPVADRQAQVLAPAAAGEVAERDPEDAARPVHPGAVADAEVVALAGDHHVVVAVVAHPDGAAEGAGDDGAGDGERVALAFLAAEAAAHPPHLDPDRVHRQAGRRGHLVLDLGRVLRRTLHRHPVLGRQRQRDLAFEVEMLLPADVDPPLDDMRGAGDGAVRVAPRPDHRPALEPAAGGQRLLHGQDRRQVADLDPALPRRLPRRDMAFRHHQKDRLADIMHPVRRQERLVMDRGRDVVLERQVGRGPDRDDTGAGVHFGQVQRQDLAMRHGREPEGEVQRIGRQGDVVDIARRAGDVQMRRLVGQGLRHAHGATSSTSTRVPVRSRK